MELLLVRFAASLLQWLDARLRASCPVSFDDLVHARLVCGYEIDILTGEIIHG
jgi:hypothetical protein